MSEFVKGRIVFISLKAPERSYRKAAFTTVIDPGALFQTSDAADQAEIINVTEL